MSAEGAESVEAAGSIERTGNPPAGEPRRIVVVGTGLVGTSIALAMRERGAEVFLADQDAGAVRLAQRLGAGVALRGWCGDTPAVAATVPCGGGPTRGAGPAEDQQPTAGQEAGETEGAGGAEHAAPVDLSEPADLAVLAVPPGTVAAALLEAQKRDLARTYTDVASVKAHPLAQAAALGCDLSSFVAGHPLAGRERSGPAAARADLFLGRPWALCPTPESRPEAVEAATALARACGAEPLTVDVAEHDHAVAVISHGPHVVSAAVAARLTDAGDTAPGLAGQGVRDVTRIAAGDPALWLEILTANAVPVADVLESVATDLVKVAAVLRVIASGTAGTAGMAAATDLVADLLRRGVAGRSRIPGKHGGIARPYAVVAVVIHDRPGELVRLFAAAGDSGINVEDVTIEHSPGLPVGLAELSVKPEEAARLAQELRARGWSVPR